MKTFAAKEKRSTPAVSRSHHYVHYPMSPVQQTQQAEIRRILHSTGAQAKLTIGQPNDKYEQEADRVADEVMRMPEPAVQFQPLVNEEDEELIQAKSLIQPLIQRQTDLKEDKEEDLLQAKAHSGHTPTVGPTTHTKIQSLNGGGQPLPDSTRSFFEPRFGYDFTHVRVHSDNEAADTAKSINARAFTLGNHVVMGAGEYQPRSQSGKRLLGHELTHVIQQRGHCLEIVQRLEFTPTACHGTARLPGDIDYPGTLEHIAIEQFYVSMINPLAETEYLIPNSGPNGGVGFADIVDPIGGGIYEIKFFPLAANAVGEVFRYVTAAEIHCARNVLWHSGVIYPPMLLPFLGDLVLVSWLYASGVIAYFLRPKKSVPFGDRVYEPVRVPVEDIEPLRVPVEDLEPVRIPVEEPVLDQIRDFIRRVAESGEDTYEAARDFLREHPEAAEFLAGLLIGVAIGIVVATLIEDILTLGAGILDDPASFAAAYALVRVAQQLQQGIR